MRLVLCQSMKMYRNMKYMWTVQMNAVIVIFERFCVVDVWKCRNPKSGL